MRICFICGSLEPGRDGVGDYTRRLACELIRRGNKIEVIALNDRYVQVEWKGMQQDNNTNVSVIRLSYLSSWQDRLHCMKDAIAGFEPEWISLQFVLFTFNNKGLPFRLANKIKRLNNGVSKWHFMFHELWVGMNKEAPLKLQLIGVVQKQIIRSFVRKVKPFVVHTHASVYLFQLKKIKIRANLLPLFTNLFVDDALYTSSSIQKKAIEKNLVIFSLFGGIHAGAPIKEFADELVAYSKKKNLTPQIKIIGRSGKEQQLWLETFTSVGISIKILGELSIEQVTQELCTSHYGISTTPKLLAEKSSALATMLGHRLPVLCVAQKWQLHETIDESIQGVFSYEVGNLSSILETETDEIRVHTLTDICTQFLYDLSLSS